MKRIILFLLLLISWKAVAHEDTYKAVEKSNVHITIKVGYESSLELRIVESYAEIINDFIKEIDSTEKVFIQFTEDYCFFYEDLYFLAYGEFKNFLQIGFPWGFEYNMGFINTQKGINVIISEKYFKLNTLLQLLEFGLQNKNYIIGKGKPSEWQLNRYESETISMINSAIQSESASIIDSIMQNELSYLTKKYLSKKIAFHDIPKELTQKNIELFLQNDSILFVDSKGSEILKLSTINSIYYDSITDCLFIVNTNRSFYFINQNLKSNKKQYEYDFLFYLDCSVAIRAKYIPEKSKYELDVGKEIFFDEINGITENKKPE